MKKSFSIRLLTAITLITSFSLLMACSGESDEDSLDYLTISDHEDMGTLYGDQINYNQLHKIVIKDTNNWTLFWNQYTEGKTPKPEKPAIDFSKHIAIGIFMEVSNPCVSFKISKVTEEGPTVIVHYESVSSNTICTQVTADKAEIITIEKTEKTIEFRKTNDTVTR